MLCWLVDCLVEDDLLQMTSVAGIRSLSFKKDIITIGTGMGVVLFFDVRAMKYLDNMCGHPCQLAVGPGWLVSAGLELCVCGWVWVGGCVYGWVCETERVRQ